MTRNPYAISGAIAFVLLLLCFRLCSDNKMPLKSYAYRMDERGILVIDTSVASQKQRSETPLKSTEKGKKKNNKPQNTGGGVSAPLDDAKAGVSFNLAPAAVGELKAPNVKAYIETFSRASVAEMDKYGIPASITMAQAIIESRSGTSILAQSPTTYIKDKSQIVRRGANNHFGIKCFIKPCKIGHCTNQMDDSPKDFFKIFPSAEASFRGHSEFLVNQARYKGLLQYGKNYKLWALKLREFGYATDPTYDKKLIAIIEKYELYKLDDL